MSRTLVQRRFSITRQTSLLVLVAVLGLLMALAFVPSAHQSLSPVTRPALGAGMMIDPNGVNGPLAAGMMIDPNGGSGLLAAGCGMDPNGSPCQAAVRSELLVRGMGIDPDGQPN